MATWDSGESPFQKELQQVLDSEGFQSFFGAGAETVKAFVLNLWHAFFPGSSGRFYWLYLLATVLLMFVIFWTRRGRGAKGLNGREEKRSLREFFFPPGYYSHVSAWVDVKLYLFNKIVLDSLFIFISFYALWPFIKSGVVGLMTSMFGPGPELEATLGVKLALTLAIPVAADLGFFLAHYALHHSAVLWEFHKVHHSAEVLTPLTGERNHPIEQILNSMAMAFGIMLVMAVFSYFVPIGVKIVTILNVGAVIFFSHVIGNLRHHHVSLRFPVWIEKWVQSPAMHHVHHSMSPHHCNKNLGLIFSFWDRLAGSFYLPKPDEPTPWGFDKDEHHRYRTLWGNLKTPFVNIWNLRRPAGTRSTLPR
jgi:sterol desaturase/sphingolipid hydroxylase (fatty acid hydroxylase superfamily)